MGAHAYTLAHGIAGLGHDVTVLTEGASRADEYADGSVHVRALPRCSHRYWKLGRLLPMPWLRRSIAVWRALQRLHLQRRFDFIRFPDGYGEGFRHSFSPLAPFSVHLHGPASLLQRWDRREVPRVRARVETWMERRPASRAPLLVAGTHWFADLMAVEWGLDRNRIRIIRNPIDTEKFRPADQQSSATGKTVLYAGHLQWFKGVSTLAAAIPFVLADHPDARFQFIGNDTRTAPGGGSIRQHVEQLLAPSGALSRVNFLPPMPHAELIGHYQACAALVLPSFQEVYGNVVIEAMACGRPCIVTNTVGASELVSTGKSGFVVPPDDPEALAAAISRLLALPATARDEMGRTARETVERVSALPVISAQTVTAFRETLRTRRAVVANAREEAA